MEEIRLEIVRPATVRPKLSLALRLPVINCNQICSAIMGKGRMPSTFLASLDYFLPIGFIFFIHLQYPVFAKTCIITSRFSIAWNHHRLKTSHATLSSCLFHNAPSRTLRFYTRIALKKYLSNRNSLISIWKYMCVCSNRSQTRL